ncbi:hypothetical protein [Nocardia wallacei]|uniref:hypothetical protein n=1 Tax=Nocardia wallacei TaxID=480035 RepID=UPI0024538E07|nr:hypothetical protein [Nocardia wallacei]
MTTPLVIRPAVYYDAAGALTTAANNLFTEVDSRYGALSAGASMAGTYEEAKKWAESYDQHAFDALTGAAALARTMAAYAGTLRTLGHNHDVAEHTATHGDNTPAPDPPPLPAPLLYTCHAPLPSAGGPVNGLDEPLRIAEKVGIIVPNGDTEKLGSVADVWTQMQTAPAVSNLPAEIERIKGFFADIQTPECEYIEGHLAQLKTAADAVPASFGVLATACRDHSAQLAALREELKTQLEDLGKELAKELAITAAIGIATSFVTFGIGAAVASAKAVEIAARFARPIRAIIDAWKARNKYEGGIKGARTLQDVAKERKALQDIEQLGKKSADDLGKPSGMATRAELTQEEKFILNRGPTDRYGNDMISAIRENRVTPQMQEDINAYNRALDKLPPYEGKVVRHTELPKDELDSYIPGQPKTERAYTCTSTNPLGTGGGVNVGTKDVEYRITSKTGRQIHEYGGTKDEVQFKDQTDFFVRNKYFDDESQRWIIVMDEI